MKKISLLLIVCFLFLTFSVYASDDSLEGEEIEETVSRGIRVPDRTFEAGLNAGFGFANNVLTTEEIFQKTLILDIDKLGGGLKVDLGIGVTPLYFKYDSGRGWGFGLSTGADAIGTLGLSGDMLSLKMTDNSRSDLSGAVFGSVGIDTFFRIKQFKLKFKPAIYYTFFYLKPNISYTYNNTDQETRFFINIGLQIFTAYSPETSKLTAEPGADFSLGVEYPLLKELDVGVDFVNVPIVSSTIKSYEKTSTVLGSKEPVSVEELMSAFGLGDAASVYGESDEKVYRPFKMLFRADWRPFIDKVPLSIIPTIGFSVCQLYVEPAAIEAGLKARLDFANRFIFTLGIGYYDRLWKNSIDLALNFRAVEYNIGADLRAQDFAQSWEGYGFGLRVGFKFGW